MNSPLYKPMILLNPVIQMFALPNFDFRIVSLVVNPNPLFVCTALVNINNHWNTTSFNILD